MNRRGGGIPLAARVRSPPGPHAVVSCPARHCWVADAVDSLGEKRPGLLVEWRHGARGWEGRVVYAAQLRRGGWLLVEEWVPADRLTPV